MKIYSHLSKSVFLFLGILLLLSCEKEEDPIKLPKDTGLTSVKVFLGKNYENEIYYDINENKTTTVPFGLYDLAFESAEKSFKIKLNSGNIMAMAWDTKNTDWNTPITISPDTNISHFVIDQPTLNPDSLALGSWFDIEKQSSNNHIYVIDLGASRFKNQQDRYRKLQIISVDVSSYTIRYGKLADTDFIEKKILKDSESVYTYFTFSDNGKVLKVSPEKDKWHFVFTTYVQVFPEEPIEFRKYIVRGALTNHLNGVKTFAIKSDFDKYPKFNDFKYSDIDRLNINSKLSAAANIIGHDWKAFDIQGNYKIQTNFYYIIQDKDQNYYKIRFVDFYDSDGSKGYPQFEIEKL